MVRCRGWGGRSGAVNGANGQVPWMGRKVRCRGWGGRSGAVDGADKKEGDAFLRPPCLFSVTSHSSLLT